MVSESSKRNDRQVTRCHPVPAPAPPAKVVAAAVDPEYLQQLFAANVRQARKQRGLTQEDLADQAELDRTYISSIERGLRNVSIQNIQRIALALNVDPRDLLGPGKLTA